MLRRSSSAQRRTTSNRAGSRRRRNRLLSGEDQRGLLSVGSLAGVFSALAAVMLVTSEY